MNEKKKHTFFFLLCRAQATSCAVRSQWIQKNIKKVHCIKNTKYKAVQFTVNASTGSPYNVCSKTKKEKAEPPHPHLLLEIQGVLIIGVTVIYNTVWHAIVSFINSQVQYTVYNAEGTQRSSSHVQFCLLETTFGIGRHRLHTV